MKRAMLVALSTGAVITSAAALSVGQPSAAPALPAAPTEVRGALAHLGARAQQRQLIEARHREARARCDALGGFRRDQCLVKAHAAKGRALLASAAPYEVRF